MVKDMRLEAIQELKKEFEAVDKSVYMLSYLYRLLYTDFVPTDSVDVYEVNNTNYSKSIIDGWTSHTEESKYYSFHVEMVKKVNNKVVSEWVKIEHDEKDLLIKLHDILQG